LGRIGSRRSDPATAIRARRRDNPSFSRVPFMAYPTPLHDASGRLVGAVNMLVDLTAAKEADEARGQLNETLERHVEERTQQLTPYRVQSASQRQGEESGSQQTLRWREMDSNYRFPM
jgi:hypothetical protein